MIRATCASATRHADRVLGTVQSDDLSEAALDRLASEIEALL